MRFAIVGAGGIGGYFGAGLSRAGHDVRLLARGENLAAIRSRGLEVREPAETWTARPSATGDPAELGPADAAIVSVKSYSLREVSGIVRELAEKGALVVPLLNGVTALDDLVSAGVPRGQILPGLAVISVEKSEPGVVTRRSDFRSIVLGEPGGGPSERGGRIAAALRETGADAKVSDDIGVDLWRKFLFLSTIAAACGLARASIGAVRDAIYGKLLLERALGETAAIARRRGVALPEGEEQRVLPGILALAGNLKPSFLLDLERGGPNELDVLSGAIARFGRENGVPTPVHDTAVAAFSAVRPGP
ncbi:MAG TPA: ketopantoate reductase family protein [Thermoanaerobaculia bacterium]